MKIFRYLKKKQRNVKGCNQENPISDLNENKNNQWTIGIIISESAFPYTLTLIHWFTAKQ